MKTAVEWLEEKLIEAGLSFKKGEAIEIEQAKEIEKQQIIDAFWNGDNTDCLSEQNAKEFAEEYYNETFKK